MTNDNRRPGPTLLEVADAIDIQLAADSDEVLPRDHAQLLAVLLTDLLNPRGHACRPGTRAPEAHTQNRKGERHDQPHH